MSGEIKYLSAEKTAARAALPPEKPEQSIDKPFKSLSCRCCIFPVFSELRPDRFSLL